MAGSGPPEPLVYCIRPINTLIGRCLPDCDGLAPATVDLHTLEGVTPGALDERYLEPIAGAGEAGERDLRERCVARLQSAGSARSALTAITG